jgi:hypothetical protein
VSFRSAAGRTWNQTVRTWRRRADRRLSSAQRRGDPRFHFMKPGGSAFRTTRRLPNCVGSMAVSALHSEPRSRHACGGYARTFPFEPALHLSLSAAAPACCLPTCGSACFPGACTGSAPIATGFAEKSVWREHLHGPRSLPCDVSLCQAVNDTARSASCCMRNLGVVSCGHIWYETGSDRRATRSVATYRHCRRTSKVTA